MPYFQFNIFQGAGEGGEVIHWGGGRVEKQSFSFSFLFLDTNLGGKIWRKKKPKKPIGSPGGSTGREGPAGHKEHGQSQSLQSSGLSLLTWVINT